MQFVSIIPRDDWRNTAGVRIRYDRIRPYLEALGHGLELQPIDRIITDKNPSGDVYIFSKCHDVRAALIARQLQAAGKTVGIDVFDDYYSSDADSAFVHLRAWFQSLASQLDFAMCSTPNMEKRLQGLLPNTPVLVMNDPADTWRAMENNERLNHALERALRTKHLEIAWFGIGDNPYFPLGLDDLSAFSADLLKIRAAGYSAHLTILTNRRALDARRLEMISRLPFACTLDEWSEEAETEVIANSIFCFLPVNGQEFSTVKSLNRAVSVLTRGSQILSLGFELYDQLSPFIYRDASELLTDLQNKSLKLRTETLVPLHALMSKIGSAKVEANRLVSFCQNIQRKEAKPWPGDRPVVVVHGNQTLGAIHKEVQKNGYLSVGMPNRTVNLHFDIETSYSKSGEQIVVLARRRAMQFLRDEFVSRAENIAKKGESPVHLLHLDRSDLPNAFPLPSSISGTQLTMTKLSQYGNNMACLHAVLDAILINPQVFYSELSSPYWAPDMNAGMGGTSHVQ